MEKLLKMLSLGIVLVLAGCQSILDEPTKITLPTVTIPHNDPLWLQHIQQIDQIESYSAQGQFGYISITPRERFSSHFDFQYKNQIDFSLSLSSNLSTKSLKLQRNRNGLTVSDSNGNSRTEADINALMEEIIGVAFPIDQFAFWLKGKPEGNSDYKINEQRRLAEFNYSLTGQEWKVSYVEYHTNRPLQLPKLIVLENADKTLKIRIDQWQH